MNNYDSEATIPCGEFQSFADGSVVSWWKSGLEKGAKTTKLGGSDGTMGDMDVIGYKIGGRGQLLINKEEKGFSPDDVALFKCEEEKKNKEIIETIYKLKVNFLLDRRNLSPTVRRKFLNEKLIMKMAI